MAHEFKKGDRFKVTLEGVVQGQTYGDLIVNFDGHKIENAIKIPFASANFTFVPKPLAVGDRVKMKLRPDGFTVLALDGGYAWLLGDGWRPVVQTSELTRV